LTTPARAVAALAALIGAPVFASESTLDAAHVCGRIEAEAARLECYDWLFRNPPAVAPASREAEFGLTEQERRERERASGAAPVPEEIASTVLRVIVKRPDPPVLQLENGQEWRLLESSDFAPFRAGDHITIRRGAIGSYLASAKERPGAWRVRRVE
jgi:hypothetical protein